MTEVRIDKFLWAVRIFKTRSIAAEACKKGKIMMGGIPMKPSRNVKTGDVLQVKRPPIIYSFKILALAHNRMNAKLVPDFLENVTTAEQLHLLELAKISGIGQRQRGTGRPTKKERRDLDNFTTPEYIDEDFDEEFDEIFN
ncbi:MAG: RNA-binding S4 domain-containing protein [Prevotellaceae bacterium]|jgi:ribosome-associated heat shock protein Hsp15|nr:RNA-binding S4 domain-containing protein [Prevotellaceae bacterium]